MIRRRLVFLPYQHSFRSLIIPNINKSHDSGTLKKTCSVYKKMFKNTIFIGVGHLQRKECLV